MSRKFVFFLTSLLLGASSLVFPPSALATTPLTRAVIQALRNDVDLIPQGQSSRTARLSDAMTPGDALSTERQSFAELRFNDGSLARVGERVLFRFIPNTRTFRLNNGTMLLLVPPGQGRTRIQTPNATAGIRGSALFVRYNEETNTTLVGALTDSGIEVFNQDETQQYGLRPGDLAVIVDGRIERVYQFDMERFYETSELVRGLNLDADSYYANRGTYESQPADEAIALVRDETLDALGGHTFEEGNDILETPSFLWMSATPDDLEDAGLTGQPSGSTSVDTRPGLDNNPPDVDRVLDAAEFQDRLNPGDRPSPANQPNRPNNQPNPPSNNPGNTPGNPPGNTPSNPPGNNPGNTPSNNPGNTPSNNPGNTPSNNPGNNPGNTPGNPPGNNPGNTPGNTPSNPPGNPPGNTPSNPPGNNPGNRPDTPPGQDGNQPGNRPDVPPGQEENPGNGGGNGGGGPVEIDPELPPE